MKNGNVLQAGSINSTIRCHMKKLGISEKYPCLTQRAIRKMYARERIVELRGPVPLTEHKAEMKAVDVLSAELGHGKNRTDLYNVYVPGL